MTVLKVPDLSLVVLVGVTGSGKSTFARRHFRPTEVISSDFCRGLVSDDASDQSATTDAFDVLHFIAGKRLAAGRLTVVDATSVQPSARQPLIALARRHHVLAVAIVLDVPEATCAARNSGRQDRAFGPHVLRQQQAQLRRSVRGLRREGFHRVFVLRGEAEVDQATVEREPLWNDRRTDHGPFDIIGDVHGCFAELTALLGRLGYAVDPDGTSARHPEGRTAVFVGDLVDRGPATPAVLRLVMGMTAEGSGLSVAGNHEAKLVRALRGRQVSVTHGLELSLAQLAAEPPGFSEQVAAFADGLLGHVVFDDGRLVVAHAGLPAAMHGRASAAVRAFALYGDTTGETDSYGLPVRYPWAQDYRGRAMVVYGHTPVPEPEWVNGTICLDTGCVFGGRLTALRYPERELVSVPAGAVYYQPARPLAASPPVGPAADPATADSATAGSATAGSATAGSPAVADPLVLVGSPAAADPAAGREPAGLDLADVTGKRIIETRLTGSTVTIREENAVAALEVMSRFAVDPRWLIYLPPTMSPSAASDEEGFLEHPREALGAYRAAGVTDVVCEEKHMGSRAVVIACADESVAARRFGIPGAGSGVIYTRTGRAFFGDRAVEQELLRRVTAAIGAAGLWAELGTDWLALDCELLPWSAKAGELLRGQYAPVGAAAIATLDAETQVLAAAAARGVDAADLLQRSRERVDAAAGFVAAYRRYCWPVDSVDDLRLAPFQVLAGEGSVHALRGHGWHLDVLGRLCDRDPAVLRRTRSVTARPGDPASEQAATAWWQELTAAGGEGMVVKPAGVVHRGPKGLAQPGIKCRGPEYLRLIYGPEYLAGPNLSRLRPRSLGHKRSLALREFALGIEALERFTAGEPLYRVHQCVFGVLALESEPVDPRL
jgi:protein phosphatase